MTMTKEQQIEEALEEADSAVEGANYHDRHGLARNIFDAVKDYIRGDDEVAVAKAIAAEVASV